MTVGKTLIAVLMTAPLFMAEAALAGDKFNKFSSQSQTQARTTETSRVVTYRARTAAPQAPHMMPPQAQYMQPAQYAPPQEVYVYVKRIVEPAAPTLAATTTAPYAPQTAPKPSPFNKMKVQNSAQDTSMPVWFERNAGTIR